MNSSRCRDTRSRRRELLFGGAIFVAALLIRGGAAIYLGPELKYSDEQEYHTWAQMIINGRSPEVPPKKAPLYTWFVASVLGASDDSVMAVKFVQALIGAASAVLLLLVGARLFSFAAGAVAAFIYALYPLSVYAAGTLYPQTLFGFLLYGALLALFVYGQKSNWGAGLAGALLGLAVSTVPVGTVALLPITVWYWVQREQQLIARVQRSVVMIAVCAATVAPWIIWNYVNTGELVLARVGAHGFWMGNNPMADGLWRAEVKLPAELKERFKGFSDSAMEKALYAEGIRYIRAYPARFVIRVAKRLLWFFSPVPAPVTQSKFTETKYKLITAATYTPVLILGLWGGVVHLRRRPEVMVLLLSTLLMGLVYAVFIATVRYRIPLDAFLCLLAGERITARILPRISGSVKN